MALPVYYTTVDEVLRVVPSIGSITNITSGMIYGFIGEAETMLNARLANLYTLPLSGANPSSSTYPLLQVLATDLTIYRMLSRRVFSADKMNKSQWVDRFTEANSLTWELQTGALPIVDSSGGVVARDSSAGIWSNTSGYLPTFDVGDQFWQQVDMQRTYDVETAKGLYE